MMGDADSVEKPALPVLRSQAIEHASARRYGTVLLARPVSFSALTTLFSVVAAGIVVLFVTFSYTRKSQVSGILLPNLGIVRVASAQAGVAVALRVHEGQVVAAGDVMFVLSNERESSSRGAAETTISRLLQSRRESLQAELNQQLQQASQRVHATTRRTADLEVEIRRIQEQRILQDRRVSLAQGAVARSRELAASKYISEAALQDRIAELLDQQQRLAELDRAAAGVERDLSAARAELADITLQAERDQQTIRRNISALDQELTENEARREVLVRAPQAGTVSAITVQLGQSIANNQPLASILPAGSDLGAELYVPSRPAGFIKPGMKVLLRYPAYPYQKFGQHHGTVRDVSSIPLRVDELPLPVANTNPAEPLYRVRVKLAKQTVPANGTTQELKSGMAVDASVLLERRKLYEWVLEPLYTVTGRPFVLKGVDLAIPAGQCVAITGPSGCGKTTLMKLLLGLMEPTEGEILVGGIRLEQLGAQNFRRLVGTVMQDDQLFAGSIADNISFFDAAPDHGQIESCARLAAIHAEIASMPMGYNTLVGDIGTGLSGGQKQRILLARALYKNPKILALDEATSHLDVWNEQHVNAAIKKIALTRVIVAHRPERSRWRSEWWFWSRGASCVIWCRSS